MKKDQLFAAPAEAWEMMFDFPPPRFLRPGAAVRPASAAVLVAVPFWGFVSGALPALVFAATGTFLPRFGNAVLFAAAMTVLLTAKDSGRGFRLLPELCRAMFSGAEPEAVLPRLAPRRMAEISDLGSTLCAFLTLGFWLSAFTYLGSVGATLWAVPVMLADMTTQAHLLSLRDLRSGAPFLQVSREERNRLWIPAVFLMLFPALAYPLAVLVTCGVCGAFALAARQFAEERCGGATAEMITLAGVVAELAALLCGVLLIR